MDNRIIWELRKIKYIMPYFKNIYNDNLSKYKQEFFLKKFKHNNLNVLFFSFYLTIEQMYYGLFVREPNTVIQKIHFISAGVMAIFALISTYMYIQTKKSVALSWVHKIYEISFGFSGFLIAVIRSLLIQDTIFPLPTIYIAVIYGFAVIFYFNPFKTLFIYIFNSIILIITLPIFQPTIIQNSYIQDIISNNTIAWIVSVMNYQRYVKEFIHQRTISENNKELKQKTIQIQNMNKKLKKISITDGLTRIYNRRKLDQVLKNEYYRAKRYGREFSILLLDIDCFKVINDTYGHNMGDKVLIELSKILRKNIRNSDILGRWGGEEFLIICPETNTYQASMLAQKLRKIIENHQFPTNSKKTCSFGVATYKEGDSIYNLINRADKGLYQAKENGRNTVKVII